MILSIAENYLVVNEEDSADKPLKGKLNVDGICVVKKLIDQVINDLDNRFNEEKERFLLELADLGIEKDLEVTNDDVVSFNNRSLALVVQLYDLACTNKLLNIKEKLEKSIAIMYNENVIDDDYIAEFYYRIARIELYYENGEKALESIKVALESVNGNDYGKKRFDEVFGTFKQILIQIGQENEYCHELKPCLEKVYGIVVAQEDVRKIEELIAAIKHVMEACGESDNVEFYLYDVYEKLLDRQSYFSVMHCEVNGEGYQAKMLLIKKLKVDDASVARIISESTGIAESTAFSYLNRSRIPAGAVREFIENTFECAYEDVIVSPMDQIMNALKPISLNVEEYFSDAGLAKVEYLHQKSVDLKYPYGEVFALIYVARLKFMFKDKDAFELMDKVVSRGKKIGFEIYTLAVTERAFMMYISGENEEVIKKLELHRKKIKSHNIWEEYLGKFYNVLGLSYRRVKDYSKAKRYMEMAYDYTNDIKYKTRRRTIIGLILRSQGKYAEAIRNYKKSLSLTSRKVEHAIAYNNIGYVYITLKEYDRAIVYTEKALELVDNVRFMNQRFNYHDTLFEIILLTRMNNEQFSNAFSRISKDLLSLDNVYEQFNVVHQCFNKVVRIIIMHNDEAQMRKLLNILDEAINHYSNDELANKVRVIFAESILNFIKANMIEGVL